MPAIKWGAAELQEFMHARGVEGELSYLAVPTPTVEAAARAVNANPGQIIKSILFLVDEQPVLAIADLYGVGKKRVKLASAETVLEISGYEVGAMPPFGHRQPLATLIDPQVLALTQAYAGGGAENVLVHLNPQEILRVSGAKILDLIG